MHGYVMVYEVRLVITDITLGTENCLDNGGIVINILLPIVGIDEAILVINVGI